MSNVAQAQIEAPVMTLVPTNKIALPMNIDAAMVPHQPEQIRAEIKTLSSHIRDKYMQLSTLLVVVRDKEYYKSWGFTSFEQYIQEDLEMHVETANTWVAIETHLIAKSGLTREEVADMGWTKAKALLPAARKGLITTENKTEIVEKAKAMPTSEVREYVHKDIMKEQAPSLQSVSYFFTQEQHDTVKDACQLAGEIINNTNVSAQLAAIAQDYLSSISEHDTHAPDAYQLRRLATIVDVLEKVYGLRVILEGKTAHGLALLKKFQATGKTAPVI